MKIKCIYCGKEFDVTLSRIKAETVKFCSISCKGKWTSKNWIGENNPNYKSGLPHCKDCGKLLNTYGYTHCQSCYVRAGDKNPNYKGGNIKRICEVCGKEFFVKLCRIKKGNGNFCSHGCFAKARIGEKSGNWQGGLSFEPYPPSFNGQLKDKIRVRDNFICQLCGVPELECDKRLAIHHIDYDKKNCEDNNLLSLCQRCNSKVNANREYWTKYFQKTMQGVN